jgi:hypothetical protein
MQIEINASSSIASRWFPRPESGGEPGPPGSGLTPTINHRPTATMKRHQPIMVFKTDLPG